MSKTSKPITRNTKSFQLKKIWKTFLLFLTNAQISILSISRKKYPCWMWMCVSNFCLIVLTFYYSMKFLLNRCTPFSMLYLGKVLQVTKFHCLQALIYGFHTKFSYLEILFNVVFVNSPISLTNAVSFIWMLNLIGDLTHWLGETPSILTHYILS